MQITLPIRCEIVALSLLGTRGHSRVKTTLHYFKRMISEFLLRDTVSHWLNCCAESRSLSGAAVTIDPSSAQTRADCWSCSLLENWYCTCHSWVHCWTFRDWQPIKFSTSGSIWWAIKALIVYYWYFFRAFVEALYTIRWQGLWVLESPATRIW